MGFIISLLISAVPVAVVWAIVRHGPFRSRWWRGERVLGFALAIGAIAFLAGFVGPMVLAPSANQGPLLGIFITGPVGLLVGLVWGLARAAGRRQSAALPPQ
ncbi:MAG TPA: hypothetical protein VLV45_14175 [Gemmatimonadales bacterium]|nr:hypothetical protein [Gemmatimonadales bacterium]